MLRPSPSKLTHLPVFQKGLQEVAIEAVDVELQDVNNGRDAKAPNGGQCGQCAGTERWLVTPSHGRRQVNNNYSVPAQGNSVGGPASALSSLHRSAAFGSTFGPPRCAANTRTQAPTQ